MKTENACVLLELLSKERGTKSETPLMVQGLEVSSASMLATELYINTRRDKSSCQWSHSSPHTPQRIGKGGRIREILKKKPSI